MKIFLIRYLLETQLWVSGMITCLSLFFDLLYDTVDYYRLGIVFFLTLAGYNYMYFHKFWIKYSRKKTNLVIFLLSIIALFFLVIIKQEYKLIAVLLFLGIWVILYNSYFIRLKIRNIAMLKIFVIAFVWSCVVFFVGNTIVPSFSLWVGVLLFIIGITIPFDIVDVSKDVIQTIPKIVGVQCSKYISIACLCISARLFYVNFSQKFDFTLAWGLTQVFAICLLVCMPKKNMYFYTRFWVELCSSLPLIIYYIVQK